MILIGLLSACDDNSFYKVPTEVSVSFDISPNPSSNPRFTNGFIVLSEFEFEGKRLVGDDIYFDVEYEQGRTITFDTSINQEFLDFQIPQGEYSEVRLSFETYSEDNRVNLMMKGMYTRVDQSTVPLVFEFNDTESFEIRAKSEDGNTTIVLSEDVNKVTTAMLDPDHWFEVVSVSLLENANTVLRDGVETIVVNQDTNENIFDLVVNRLDESMEAIFKAK